MATAKKKSATTTKSASRRIKCGCYPCSCTVPTDKGYRKGNVVYCSEVCANRCSFNECLCGHETC